MVDPKTATEAGDRMPLVAHLEELRNRLLRSVAAVLIGAVGCWVFYPQILGLLLEPYCQLRGDLGDQALFGG